MKDIEVVKHKFQIAGVNVHLLSQLEIKKLEPSISKNVSYALFFPDVGHTQDPELLKKLSDLTQIERLLRYQESHSDTSLFTKEVVRRLESEDSCLDLQKNVLDILAKENVKMRKQIAMLSQIMQTSFLVWHEPCNAFGTFEYP